MKRGIIIISMLIVVAALAGGWWWVQNAPEQATQFLIDGGLEASRAEAFVASIGGQAVAAEDEALIASGSIEGDEVAVVSEFGGRIVRLDAEEGDAVEQHEVLVELDTSSLQAQLAQAGAAVAVAQANLANVQAGVHPAQILAAEAMLLQAEAERDAAALGGSGRPDLARQPPGDRGPDRGGQGRCGSGRDSDRTGRGGDRQGGGHEIPLPRPGLDGGKRAVPRL